jgi:hypothetical protein
MLAMLRRLIIAVALGALPVDAGAADRTHPAFELARAACAADAGALWGVDLCGPMLIVDPDTRRVVANAPGEGLVADGLAHVGELPATIAVANTAVTWNGRRWLMLAEPLPDDDAALVALALHESWHRVQDDLHLPAVDGVQSHLDDEVARVALRLELRALRAAVAATDDTRRKRAVADALAFRAWRHTAFPGSAESEARMELHEGLAEYTGRRLAGDFARRLADALSDADRQPSYARTFAYATGPAWGFLLDGIAPQWRRGLAADADLALLAAHAYGIVPAPSARAPAAAHRYGLTAIRTQEQTRAVRLRRELAAWRRQLVDGPVLVVPLTGASIAFDPRQVRPLAPFGTVYSGIRVSGVWGTLATTDAALVASDWSTVRIALVPGLRTLVLADGWQLEAGPRRDDRRIVARPPGS